MAFQSSARLLWVFWGYAEDVLGVSSADRITLPTGKAAEKSYKLSDARGLHMFVTTTGFRSWRWKYRIAGKEKLLVLAAIPT